jgi:hypothetical protein
MLIRNQQKAAPSALSCMQCHALVQARLLGQNRCSFLPFPSLSLPLPPAPFSSPSRSLITAEFFQPHTSSQSLSPPLSLFCLSGNNQGRFRRLDPSSRQLHLTSRPTRSVYAIDSASASSSQSASILCVFCQCRRPIVAAAFGCRVCPGHPRQRLRVLDWRSGLLHYFVWSAARWTMDPNLEPCSAHGAGSRRLLSSILYVCPQDCHGNSRHSAGMQHLIVSRSGKPQTPTAHGKISTCSYSSSRYTPCSASRSGA